MVTSVFLTAFYVMNIIWCLAVKKILDHQEKLQEEQEDQKSVSEQLTDEEQEAEL